MPGAEGSILLANSAEMSSNGGISALGLGWQQTVTPTPPIAIIMLIEVPWDLANRKLPIELVLVDEDGHAPLLNQDPMGNQAPVSIDGEIEVGRPVGAKPGSTLPLNQTFTLGPGLPLVPGKTYQWKLTIAGDLVATRSFSVVEMQPNPM